MSTTLRRAAARSGSLSCSSIARRAIRSRMASARTSGLGPQRLGQVQKRSLLRRAKPEHHLCQRLTVVSLSSSASELELWRLGEGDVASVVKIAHVLYADTAPVRQVNSRFDGQDHTIKQGIFGRPADPR